MDLFIVRHAWAGEHGDPRWADDSQRPLTGDGRERFAQLVDKLVRRGFSPEAIATSPMVRCRQTADLIAAGVDGKPTIIELDDLLPGGDVESLLEWTVLQSRQHNQVAWVGHAPDVCRLTAHVIGGGDAWLRFSKGAVAAIRFDGLPAAGAGELRWMVTAKVLGV
jgi:phosphohistidine phosphatase